MALPSPIAFVLLLLEQLGSAGAGDSPWLGVTILALVQGLTEFLPVSSSGHLALTSEVLERSGNAVPEAGLALNVVLHAGTLVAVAVVYGRDLVRMLTEAVRGNPRTLLLVGVGTVPAGLVGVFLKDRFEALTEDATVSAVCLLVTAALLIAGERDRRARIEARGGLADASGGRRVGFTDAILIGLAQALAILPGISRSGATIATGLLRGLDAREAARFSFLLGFVAISGAAVLEVPDALADDRSEPLRLLFGFVLSAVVGVAALRLLLVALSKGAFVWFALYCASVGTGWLLFFDRA